MNFSQELAKVALEIGAIKINPEQPFTWASGYQMPIYNDNRLLLGNAEHRILVGNALLNLVKEKNIAVDVVAGTATAGIPHATTLANLMKIPLIYVRPSPKEHGLKNQIEGVLKVGQSVLLIEDLVSTGGSAIKAISAIKEKGGKVNHCFCIFNYGFEEAERNFSQINCHLNSILDFPSLIQYAENFSAITPQQKDLISNWYKSPYNWKSNSKLTGD